MGFSVFGILCDAYRKRSISVYAEWGIVTINNNINKNRKLDFGQG